MNEQSLEKAQAQQALVSSRLTFSREQVDLLKATVAKGTTDDELKLFLHVCERSGLDPLAKQIYAIKRQNRKTGQSEMAIQTGIDGYRVVAERTGNYAPGKEPTYQYDQNGKLVSATAFVNKRVGDRWFEVSATAFLAEYSQDYSAMWTRMPHVMLAKVAEALALRRSFPNEMSGMYTHEEMDQANEPLVRQPVKKEPKVIAPVPAEEVEDIVVDASPEVDVPPSEPAIEFSGPEAPEEFREKQVVRSGKTPAQQMWSVIRKKGVPEAKIRTLMKSLFNTENTKDLTLKQMEDITRLVEQGAVK